MTDQSNYLNDLPEWSADLAYKLGIEEGFKLTQEHVVILNIARKFYADYGFSPSMRPPVSYTHLTLPTN